MDALKFLRRSSAFSYFENALSGLGNLAVAGFTAILEIGTSIWPAIDNAVQAGIAAISSRFPVPGVSGAGATDYPEPQGGGGNDSPPPEGGQNPPGGGVDTITFAPVFNFCGPTTPEQAKEAGQISFAEFKRLYQQNSMARMMLETIKSDLGMVRRGKEI